MDKTLGNYAVIVKTTYDCNLACLYCYEGQKPRKKQMKFETAKNVMQKISGYFPNKHIEFIWHGGEPLLLGKGFYETVVAYQKQIGISSRVKNSIQTNGILLSRKFMQFFNENDFSVGLSLDGPSAIQNEQRTYSNGKHSFDRVFSALNKVRESDLNKHQPNAYALAVITRKTLEHIDDFYNFFRDNRISVKINPLFLSGSATTPKSSALHLSPEEYGEVLIYLFERWVNEKEYIFDIEPFPGILRSFVTGKTELCAFSNTCTTRFLSVDPDGFVTPCGRWSKEDFCLGNINNDSMDVILKSEKYLEYVNSRKSVEQMCNGCQYFPICNGGCTFSSYIKNNSLSDNDYYCESYKSLFSFVEKTLQVSLQ